MKSIIYFYDYPVIRFNISLAKVIIIPPARVQNPLALCDGSCDFNDSPTCTIPNPSSIIPIARIKPKIKLDKLFTTLIGSPAAKASAAPAKKKNHADCIHDK